MHISGGKMYLMWQWSCIVLLALIRVQWGSCLGPDLAYDGVPSMLGKYSEIGLLKKRSTGFRDKTTMFRGKEKNKRRKQVSARSKPACIAQTTRPSGEQGLAQLVGTGTSLGPG